MLHLEHARHARHVPQAGGRTLRLRVSPPQLDALSALDELTVLHRHLAHTDSWALQRWSSGRCTPDTRLVKGPDSCTISTADTTDLGRSSVEQVAIGHHLGAVRVRETSAVRVTKIVAHSLAFATICCVEEHFSDGEQRRTVEGVRGKLVVSSTV